VGLGGDLFAAGPSQAISFADGYEMKLQEQEN
jgi:hypothetical protein